MPLIRKPRRLFGKTPKTIPLRPAEPESFPEANPRGGNLSLTEVNSPRVLRYPQKFPKRPILDRLYRNQTDGPPPRPRKPAGNPSAYPRKSRAPSAWDKRKSRAPAASDKPPEEPEFSLPRKSKFGIGRGRISSRSGLVTTREEKVSGGKDPETGLPSFGSQLPSRKVSALSPRICQ